MTSQGLNERDWVGLLSRESYCALGPRELGDDASDAEIDHAAQALMLYAQATRARILEGMDPTERRHALDTLRRAIALFHGVDVTPKSEKHAIASRVADVFGQTPATRDWDRKLVVALVIRCVESINRETAAELERRIATDSSVADDFCAAVAEPHEEFARPLYRLLGEPEDQEEAFLKWAKRLSWRGQKKSE